MKSALKWFNEPISSLWRVEHAVFNKSSTFDWFFQKHRIVIKLNLLLHILMPEAEIFCSEACKKVMSSKWGGGKVMTSMIRNFWFSVGFIQNNSLLKDRWYVSIKKSF